MNSSKLICFVKYNATACVLVKCLALDKIKCAVINKIRFIAGPANATVAIVKPDVPREGICT